MAAAKDHSPTHPADCPRRSFVYRKLLAAGAGGFVKVGDAMAADNYGDLEGERLRAGCAGLVDLCPMPRIGFKGKGCLDWLRAAGLRVPDAPNRSAAQDDGAIIATLDKDSALVLGNPRTAGGDPLPAKLQARWSGGDPSPPPWGLPLHWQDSHAWYLLTGARTPEVLAGLCSMDLRPQHFPEGGVAQTSVAHLGTVVIREATGGGQPAYHLLADSAAAGYFYDELQAAVAEFGGGPAGLRVLRAAPTRQREGAGP
ncbi:MAG: hypothetical protein OXU43_02470 [Gammaproteobacteria bacterium]|nr:hypothetical protein [Gammaproteobacteria bacterium]